jgi:uncharacterized membrane protein
VTAVLALIKFTTLLWAFITRIPKLPQDNLRRTCHQAQKVGTLAAASAGVAGLRLLKLVGVVLLVLTPVMAELLFLSFVETET